MDGASAIVLADVIDVSLSLAQNCVATFAGCDNFQLLSPPNRWPTTRCEGFLDAYHLEVGSLERGESTKVE